MIEARHAYGRGETRKDNPYIENTWPHRWWSQTITGMREKESFNLMLSSMMWIMRVSVVWQPSQIEVYDPMRKGWLSVVAKARKLRADK